MCRCVVANFAYEVQPEVLKIFTKYFLLLHYFEDASHTVFEDTCIVEIWKDLVALC